MKSLAIALADTILMRYPNPDDIPYRPWCYVQGYDLCGLEKLWRVTGEQRYFDYVRKFVDQHVAEDGAMQGFTGESLDDMMAGTLVVGMYEHTRLEKYRIAAVRILDSFADYPRNADGGFWHARNLRHEMWVDGVFMGGMFLSRYAAVIGDGPLGFSEVAQQIQCLAAHCRKGGSGLFLHAYDEARQAAWADPNTGLSPEVWSEGLGWYALILAEMLALMPREHAEYPVVEAILRELLEGLKQVQDPVSGLWYQVVDKGTLADNWHDTSGSGMFLYAFQRAMDLGCVPAVEYGEVVRRGYAGLRGKAVVAGDGGVDILDACDGVCVQRGYRDYIDFPRVKNAKEAVGSVLWAALSIEKLG